MSIQDIVNVQISTTAIQIEQEGFGVPLIMGYDCPGGFTERVRFYTSAAALVTDGFSATGGTYLMAAQVFAQAPKLPRIAVGRCALKPTQRWAVTPVAGNTVIYKMKVNGNAISFTSDGSGTVTEIIAGLKIAIDALSLAITVSDQTTYMRIVANAAGVFFDVSVDDITKLGILQDHADPGSVTDLNAILLEDATWYGVLSPMSSVDVISSGTTGISFWAETNKKFYVAASQESETAQHALSGATDAAAVVKTALRTRTSVIYHPRPGQFADAAWVGDQFSEDPGASQWGLKELVGVDGVALTATQRANILAKNANVYETLASVAVTNKGHTASGEWMDVIRDLDWLHSIIETDVVNALITSKKIPYTDEGVALIEGIVKADLKRAVVAGVLAASPAPATTTTKVSLISGADKAARKLTGLRFSGTLAGAIILVDPLNGTVS